MNEISTNKISSADGAAGVAGNLWWLAWSGAASVANSVLIWIFMARWRGAEELGELTIAMGFYALFFNVCSLGLSPYLVGEISRRREQKKHSDGLANFVGSALVFLFASGAICAALMAAGIFLISDSLDVRAASVVLSFALVPTGAITLAEAAAISAGRARLIAVVTTLENGLRTAAPLVLILLDYPLWAICLSFVAVRIIALAIYLFAGKFLSSFAFDWTEFNAFFRIAPTFAGTIIFASLNWQIPIILLARLSLETEAARYGAASRFLIPAAIFAASFANAIQPVLVRQREKSIGAAGSYLSRMASYVLVLTVPAAIVSPYVSGAVLSILFGAKYADAAQILDILAISVVPFALAIVAARGLIAENAQHVDLIANALGAAIGLIAGLLLVPRYGAAGAATAQLISFALVATVIIGYLTFRIKGIWLWRTAAFSLVGLIIILPVIWK